MVERVKELSVTLLAASLVFLVLPIQSYLVNKNDFSFSFGALLFELSVYWMIGVILFAVLFRMCRGRCAQLALAVVLSMSIYVYLETGILAKDYPMLDGDVGFFGNQARRIWDLAVLLVLLTSAAIFRKWLYGYVHWIAMGVLVMSFASIFDVKMDVGGLVASEIDKEHISDDEIVCNAFFSTNKNVLVFVLDSMTTELAYDVFQQSQDLEKSFSGFTMFTNNIGMHRDTDHALPSMMTGKYMERCHDYTEHMKMVVGTNTFAYAYDKSGAAVFQIAHVATACNWTNRLKKRLSVGRTVFSLPTASRLHGQQMWNLREIVAFRSMPFWIKRNFYLHAIKGWPNAKRSTSEDVLYPKLATLPLNESGGLTLHIYHTEGSHSPYTIDKEGNTTSEPRPNYSGAFDKTHYALSRLSFLFEQLRQRGIYDDAFIVVTADHGADQSKRKTMSLNGFSVPAERPFPALMVKVCGAKGTIDYSSTPTSHSRIRDMAVHELTRRQTKSDVEKILSTQDRLFREFESFRSRHLDFWFDEKGSLNKVDVFDE